MHLFFAQYSYAQEDKVYWHTVNENTKNLSMVALYYYGRSSFYKKIAEWNGIPAPYRIKLGQKLKLLLPPRLNHEEGDKKLLAYWRKYFNLTEPEQEKTITKQVIKEKFVEAEKVKPVDLEFEPLDSKKLFLDGKMLFDEKKWADAMILFHKSRTLETEYLPPWFYEMKSLGELGQIDQRTQVLEEFLKTHPQLKNLPFVKQMQSRAPASEYKGAPTNLRGE